MTDQLPKKTSVRKAITIATETMSERTSHSSLSSDEDDDDSFSRAFTAPPLHLQQEEISAPEETASNNPSINTTRVKELQEKREELPVWKIKDDFFRLLRKKQVIIVEGQTGCGKTTQIPQWCVEYTERKAAVACTQPRRLAASSIAERVAEEMGVVLGEEVGYHVRFDNCTSAKTYLTYMTDGILLRQIRNDSLLKDYGVILLDETHERGIHADFLMALLKDVIQKREDLRLVIMSATLDTKKFKKYFDNPAMRSIPGRLYDIDIVYEENRPPRDVKGLAIKKVMEIHQNETKRGDILVFMSGQTDIDSICNELEIWTTKEDYHLGALRVLPLYSDLAKEEQELVFEPPPPHNGKGVSRKVIVATNIAETSITIDGIVYVIDSGFMNIKEYERTKRVEILKKVYITQTNASQRSGRAGRTQKGKCFRLYTEDMHDTEFDPYISPEILRSNLSALVLDMKSMSIQNILNFNFMDPPARRALLCAMVELRQLKALDDFNRITDLGNQMAEFPVDPCIAKILITSCTRFKCTKNILKIASMLSVPRCFAWNRRKRLEIIKARKEFMSPHGDHIMLLKLYNAYRANGESKEWCREKFVHYHHLKFAISIRSQLEAILKNLNLYNENNHEEIEDPEYIAARKALISGFCLQIANKVPDTRNTYRRLWQHEDGTNIEVHNMTGLTGEFPNFVIYDERLTLFGKPYICTVTPIEPKWWKSVVGEPVEDLLKIERE